ncbi:MAG TPA: TonB family protein [Candidatus Acidoferrales bacterium]|nr:TonB family protein [Candidatus Acidoferrales bacterium]
MPESWKHWENQIVNSRFVLRQFLGASEHSAVFLTERPGPPPENAAIKLLSCDPATKDFHFSRWHAIAKLSHPHVLRLFHYGQCRLDGRDLLYVVMELADESLTQILPLRPLTPLEAREMLLPVLDGLSFIHATGFVHGRIHPGNILAAGDQIKLSSDSLCSNKDLVTLRPTHGPYSAPEIAVRGFTAAADVYALGVTLVETLTQHAPGSSEVESLPTLPIPFNEIAERTLLAEPALRWTAAEVAARLESRPRTARVPEPTAESKRTAPASQPASAETLEIPAASKPSRAKPAPAPSAVPLSPVSPLPIRTRAATSTGYFRPLLAVAALIAMAWLAYRTLRHGPEVPVDAAIAHDQTAVPAASSSSNSPSLKNAPPMAPAPASVSSHEVGRQQKPVESQHGSTAASVPASSSAAGSQAQTPAVKPADTSKVAPASNAPERLPQHADPIAAAAPKQTLPSVVAEPSPASLRAEPERSEMPRTDDSGVLQEVQPEITQRALNTIHGSVKLGVTVQVDSSGAVSAADLSSPSGSSFFNDAALKAVRRWRFQPAGESGATRRFEIRFQLTPRGVQTSLTRPH